MISAADVAGFQRTTNYGVQWYGANAGVPPSAPPKVATVAFSNNPSTPNTVYGGTGFEGTSGTGGFMVSTDAGKTWSLRSDVPVFSGNGETNVAGLPPRWPRSTGNLIAVDETGGTKYIYAGTFKDGVMRSTDGGYNWETVGLSGKYIRSLVIDPSAPWKIYATEYGNHVWYCNTGRGNTTSGTSGWTHLTGAPDTVEEMVFVGGTLYAAGKDGSTGGVWRYNGSSWARKGASDIDTESTWLSIAGYDAGSNDVLYIGANDPEAQTGDPNYRTILKSTDSGSTWAPITLSVNIVNELGGSGGAPWWMGQTGGNSGYLLGNNLCDIAHIAIDPNNTARVIVSGRGGIWGTTNANASNSNIRWYPMMEGLMVSSAMGVAVDPTNPGRVYVANQDRIAFLSTDYGSTVLVKKPPVSSGKTSRSIYVDPYDSKVYVGTLDEQSPQGNIYSNPDPDNTSNSWTDEGLAAATGNNKRVRGVIVGRSSTNTRIILAAVEGSGIWRQNTSGWGSGPVETSINPSGKVTITFAWNPGSKYVFVYESGTGLWRSSNRGQTWTNIWTTTNSDDYSGMLVADPVSDGRLYVSVDSGVFRFNDARTGTPTPDNMNGPPDPGPIAFSNGELFVCDRIATGHNGRIYKWKAPATSTSKIEISDTIYYPGQCNWANGLAVDESGIVYVSSRGESMMVGATGLLLEDDFSDGNATGWDEQSGTWSVPSGGGKPYRVSSSSGGLTQTGEWDWSDYVVQADVKALTLGSGAVGIGLYYGGANNRYYALLSSSTASIRKKISGTETVLDSNSHSITTGTTYRVRLLVNGTTANESVLRLFVNGIEVASATDSDRIKGKITLEAVDATAEFDNVMVTEAN